MRRKPRIVCEGAQRVDGGMGDDAGEQTAAAVKDRDQQEAYRDSKDDLTQVGHQIHAAAVEQIDNVPDAKGHAGDDDRRFYVFPCNGHQQKAPEDHFLQKPDAEHAHDAADHFRWRVIDGSAVPEVSRCQNNKRYIIKEARSGDR